MPRQASPRHENIRPVKIRREYQYSLPKLMPCNRTKMHRDITGRHLMRQANHDGMLSGINSTK
ncbi:hypothetical protein CHUAL_011969 [Chamberlinius hualienensis]